MNKNGRQTSDNSSGPDEIRLREAIVREGELAVKKAELAVKEKEFTRSRWTNPLLVAILAALAAALTNAWVQYTSARHAANLEQTRWERTKADQENAWLSAQVAELAQHLSKVLFFVSDSASAFERDVGEVAQKKSLQRSGKEPWNSKEFQNAIEQIERVQIVVRARSPQVGAQLRQIVEDVRVLTRRVWNDQALLRNMTQIPLTSNQLATLVENWSSQLDSCRASLGPRIANTLRALNPTSIAETDDNPSARLTCDGRGLKQLLLEWEQTERRP